MSNNIQQNIDVIISHHEYLSFLWIEFIDIERNLALVNMVNINETDFCKNSKWQDTAAWAKPIYHCV